jgi:hypothetical protein
MNDLKDYQLAIVRRALSLMLSNYDEFDLEQLMYSDTELESEIEILLEKVKSYQLNHSSQCD